MCDYKKWGFVLQCCSMYYSKNKNEGRERREVCDSKCWIELYKRKVFSQVFISATQLLAIQASLEKKGGALVG